jgi:hypothetical protein
MTFNWKGLSGTNTIPFLAYSYVTKKMKLPGVYNFRKIFAIHLDWSILNGNLLVRYIFGILSLVSGIALHNYRMYRTKAFHIQTLTFRASKREA